jgi:phosphatidylserine decarboxylase
MKSSFIILQHLLPHHLISRLVAHVANSQTGWIKNTFIRWFIRRYQVDMDEAEFPDPDHYACFNEFFTRQLKPGARVIDEAPNAVLSPADGAISAIGNIIGDTIFQAKGRDFSLTALLGGDAARAAPFCNGQFMTVYLSPRDYHRVHMPVSGTLKEMVYVPGRLFSVNQDTAEGVDRLFARNERAVCIFETGHGPMAVVLVGAMIVAGIETVWAGQVAPAAHGRQSTDYTHQAPPIHLERGLELGRFKLGSTAIVLFGQGAVQWHEGLQTGSMVQMGQATGTLQ